MTSLGLDADRGLYVEPHPSHPIFPGYFIASHTVNHAEEAQLFGELESIDQIENLLPTLQYLA
jgi:uncharacterized protein YfeS